MSTRLDRLFVLLENGSNASIRLSAAKHLGEVAKSYPSELSSLLNRLHVYLRHKNWSTRIAAAQAVNAIAENVDFGESQECSTGQQQQSPQSFSTGGFIRLGDLDMRLVLTSGARLYSTTIDDLDEGGITLVERSELNKNIGMDSFLNSVIESHSNTFEGMLSSEDMQLHKSDTVEDSINKVSVEEIVQKSVDNKRAYNRSCSVNSTEEPPCKVLKVKCEPDAEAESTSTYWTMDNFCTRLLADLWQVKWEVRHGAATALRELLRHHAASVGRICGLSEQEKSISHKKYLEDIVSRILITLALDQLSDFVSDQVVAPVRETCAQVLGIISTRLKEDQIHLIISNLKILSSSSDWMIAQGGLLGVKYILAARQDLSVSLLPLVADNLYTHLIHSVDDDMRSSAAAALTPVLHCLNNIPSLLEPTRTLISNLWTILAGLEPLSTATSSLIDLLCALNNIDLLQNSFDVSRMEEFIRTLVVFLYHSSSQVRQSTLKLIHSIANQFISQSAVSLSVPTLSFLLDQVFQSFILEGNNAVIDTALTLWQEILPKISTDDVATASAYRIDIWLCQAMQPSKTAFSRSILNLSPRPNQPESESDTEDVTKKYFIAGSDTVMDPDDIRDSVVMETRLAASKMLASLLVRAFKSDVILENGHSYFSYVVKDIFLSLHLTSKLAIPRFVVAIILVECCKLDKTLLSIDESINHNASLCQQLKSQLETCLNEVVYYEEILGSFKVMQRECRALMLCLKSLNVSLDDAFTSGKLLNLEQCRALLQLSSKHSPTGERDSNFKEALSAAESSVDICSRIQSELQMRVQSSIACSLIHLDWLTAKLTPIIRPVMESIRRESLHKLQSRTGEGLSRLLEHCYLSQIGFNAANKVMKNLVTYLTEEDGLYQSHADSNLAILTLTATDSHKSDHINGSSKTIKSTKSETSTDKDIAHILNQRRGVTLFLECVVRHLGCRLPTCLPPLWSMLYTIPLDKLTQGSEIDKNHLDEVLSSLLCLEICLPHFEHSSVTPQSDEMKSTCCSQLCLPLVSCITQGPGLMADSGRLRHFVSRCTASLCQFHLSIVMNTFLPRLLSLLRDNQAPNGQFGALETLYYIIERLSLQILPFIVLFLVPVLGLMSNSTLHIRMLANSVFANLMCLMPLEDSAPDPEGLEPSWTAKRKSERQFLECLMDPKKISLYSIPIPISVELRNYQQEGVNWLAFLNRYCLHGVLCDDLGLGKTLQTICILAGDHYQNKQAGKSDISSLVICPSTLVGHWLHEIKRFVDPTHLKPLLYAGNPDTRQEIQKISIKYNLIIASYEIVRNDIDFFKSKLWNYVVLDEGHVIRNTKAKLTKSIKSLKSSHRLVLTGTPIQNQVVELWSIFDFLMPGFLGTEQQFSHKYAKPIALSNDSKATSKEQEAGALALQSLHRQVLPFMLRRLKEDVLKDLPPKIIQDYTCDLTPLQSKLYDAFAKSKMKDLLDEESATSETAQKSPHAFQALQYLRKVCNHPCLVLSPDHPMYAEVKKSFPGGAKALQDLELSGKLVALKQLLIDCGLTEESSASIVKNHRVLIFCQLKSMLELVERLLKTDLPSISYLRLDGSVPSTERHDVVMKFNHDPSIDVLLLTTAIGGMGLNLTGADTVIFVENDWNPMKDLQAMDRAHRIGQKRVVSVYRLITAGTLEEKIMNLQAFKLAVANTVVSAENKDLASMKTDRLFDLFERDADTSLLSASRSNSDNRALSKGQKNILDILDQMWDTNEYESEYDVTNFLKKL